MAFFNIDNILMFTEKGYEVPLNKTYTIEWEIIPNKQIEHLFISNPKGHILIDNENSTTLFINDDRGKISIDSSVSIRFNDPDNTTIVYEPIDVSNNIDPVLSYENIEELVLLDASILGGYNKPRVRRVVDGVILEESRNVDEHIYNTVRLMFNTLESSYVKEYPINVVIGGLNPVDGESSGIVYQYNQIQEGENINDIIKYAYVGGEFIPAESPDPNYSNIIDALIKSNFDDEQ